MIMSGLPGSPSVTVKDVTSRSVTLQWSPPSDTGGVHLTGYIIEKRVSTSDIWERVATVETSVRDFMIENLKAKTEFFFRVSAENEVGVGEANMTEKVSLKTHARPPSPPTAPLEIVPLGPHALSVEWGAPESDGGAPLEGYKIAVRDARRQMWMEVGRVGTDIQRSKVQDLAEGHEYFIRIFAKNEVGFSDPLENEEPFKVVRPPGETLVVVVVKKLSVYNNIYAVDRLHRGDGRREIEARRHSFTQLLNHGDVIFMDERGQCGRGH